MNLDWMKRIGGEDPRVPASVMALPRGVRVAVAASRVVFFGVRLPEGVDPGLPAYRNVPLESGNGEQGPVLREWLTGEYRVAEVPVEALREWCEADGDTFGYIGDDRYDRCLVGVVLSYAPEAETVTVGFAPGKVPLLVLTFEGWRAVVAPGKPKKREGEPYLALEVPA